MKPNVLKIIKMDYLSKLLFIVSLFTLLLVIAIVAVGGDGIGIGILFFIIATLLMTFRVMNMIKDLTSFKDDKATAEVISTMKHNGMVYIAYLFNINGQEYRKRVGFLCGPIKKMKLMKLKEVNVVYNKENPKKSYIADFFY